MSGEQDNAVLDRVWIPSELHERIGRFFSQLQQATLRDACLRAAGRSREGAVCELTRDDVAAAVANSLAQATTSLEEVFTSQELDHVRRAS